jgi:DNA-binding transcriptional ArsR family regulator
MSRRPGSLNRVFNALADPTRRAILQRLAHGPASVSELARPFSIALPSLLQHVQVLEECGLVRTKKIGRIRTCEIRRRNLKSVESWIAAQREALQARTLRDGGAQG